MCKWNTTETFEIINRSGEKRLIDVDKCIASIVKSLNENGIITVASCCGHGKQMGNIALADGREIIIVSNYENARKIEKLFLPIN